MITPRHYPLCSRLRRLMHGRLIAPLRRHRQQPEYAARGAAVGIFWAFTPLVPVQMFLLGLTWLAARPFPALNFHPVIALAWIWVNNWLTLAPAYFVFYVTGQMMLGHWDDLSGYSAFTGEWQALADGSRGFLDTVRSAAGLIIREQGLVLAVGCMPYAVGGAWFGYHWSLKVLKR